VDRRTKTHKPKLKGMVAIPYYLALMRPDLKCSEAGEVGISNVAKKLL